MHTAFAGSVSRFALIIYGTKVGVKDADDGEFEAKEEVKINPRPK